MESRYLYKAKRKDNGEWVKGFLYIRHDGAAEISHYNEYFNVERYTYEVDETTLCRCTELTDKNGKLIWENDILHYSYDYPDSPWLKAEGKTNDDIVYRTGHVFWQEWRGCWAVSSKVGKTGTNADVFTYCRNPNRTEVIGNIFDNPELLGGQV